MSSYGISVPKQSRATIRPARKVKRKEMKLSFKQRLRNWLMNDNEDPDYGSIPSTLDSSPLNSDGMRFTLYKAAGGYVIEIRTYDRRKDENVNTMYVITEEKDLGAEMGKIITMESLR